MYLIYEAKEMSFTVDQEKNTITAKKVIHRRIYTITRPLPMMSLDLMQLINRFGELPEEFWVPID